MKADLTRNSFRYWKHFTRVLMQQGRVQLDADWNEQAAILFHYLRSSAADIIGPFGRPAANPGFVILPLNLVNPTTGDFALSAGHFFVSGILCENTPDPIFVFPQSPIDPALKTLKVTAETLAAQGRFLKVGEVLEIFNSANPLEFSFGVVAASEPGSRSLTLSFTAVPGWIDPSGNQPPCVRRALTYTKQPDFPMAQSDLVAGATRTLIYIDVWERLVTFAEDDSIREVALGGPDTAARAKLVYQVKSLRDFPFDANPVSTLQGKFQPHNRGYLRARVQPSVADTDPCIISPTSRYRGPENQLYRVEIHTGSKDAANNPLKPTFKWSRENGSVVFPILSGGGTAVVTLETLGRDDRFGLAEGDWVEVVDDDYVLLNRAGTLLQVQSIDRSTMKVTLGGTPDGSVGKDPAKHPILRRWDQKQGDEQDGGLTFGSDNAASIVEGSGDSNWLDLEDGVQIQFQQANMDKKEVAPQYRTGDYWLIPARTATGDVQWPTEVLTDVQGTSKTWIIALPPDGINHYYAPLGVINVDANGNVDFTGTPVRMPDPFGPFEPPFFP